MNVSATAAGRREVPALTKPFGHCIVVQDGLMVAGRMHNGCATRYFSAYCIRNEWVLHLCVIEYCSS